jgi:hypothetical protein
MGALMTTVGSPTPRTKLYCDICGKGKSTLGSYGYGGEDARQWWICLPCFGRADKLARRADRWPDERDYIKLKERYRRPQSGGTSSAPARAPRTTACGC